MRKSLIVLSHCAVMIAALSVSMTQPARAADSTAKPAQTAEIKPTISMGDAAAGKAASAVCAGCHGVDGIAAITNYPNLAGQGAPYIFKQLMDFKSGARENAVMQGMVANLTEEAMHNLAAYYAEMSPSELMSSPDNLETGKQIFLGGITAIQVPACTACHAPDGAGNDAAKFPRLSGQHAEYIVSALQNFRSGARANDPGKMMQMVAKRMSDDEIAAVANYVQGLH